jgi:hypothetical protein
VTKRIYLVVVESGRCCFYEFTKITSFFCSESEKRCGGEKAEVLGAFAEDKIHTNTNAEIHVGGFIISA